MDFETREAIGRLDGRLWWVWLYANIMVGLAAASLALNAVRTVKVDQGINRLQVENVKLLRERADLKARLSAATGKRS